MAVAIAFIGATCVAARTSAGETTIFAMHKHTFDQERRASARRGSQNRIRKCSATNFRVWSSRPECITRLAYASRSWSGMRALRESCVFQLQIRPEHRCVRERAQHTCVFHLQTRYVHHGGLTPPAPGCVCGRCCKCAILADEKDAFPRGAYAPRSWLHGAGLAHQTRKRSQRTVDMRDPGIRASLIAESIRLPPVALFAYCPDSGIGASLIGEWNRLPPVGLFACCPDSGIGASLIGEWNRLPPTGVFACCPDSGIGASLIAQWIEEPCKTSSRPTDVAF
jgi:hypothetical protein